MIVYFNADTFRNKPTGIYRYAYGILNVLKQKYKVCPISFYGDTGSKEFHRFIEQEFNCSIITDRRFFWSKRKYNNRFFKKRFFIYKNLNKPLRFHKYTRELLRIAMQLESLFDFLLIPNLEKNSIIFSPFEPIPKVYKNKNYLTVQMVHDIIPLRLCNFYSDSEKKNFMHVVESSFTVDLVLFNSYFSKKDYLEYFKLEDNSRFSITKLASTKKFKKIRSTRELKKVRKKYNIPLYDDYIISISTSEPRKNRKKIIEAWEKIKNNSDSDAKLVFSGFAPEDKAYWSELPKDIKSSIIFIGFVDDNDLAALYCDCMFSVFLSLYEGFGLPVLESMSCGSFCLASSTTSLPEIVGENLPMVKPDSIDDIYNNMISLINNPSLLVKYNEIAYNNSLKFDWKITGRETISAFNRAIKKKFI